MNRPTAEDPSAWRRGLQHTLVYFGLASERGDDDRPAAPSPWWDDAVWAAILGLGLTGLAWDQRGAGLGTYSLIGFVILVVMNGPWPESTRRERVTSALASFVILPVGLAVLVPDRIDVWIPVGVGAALAALLTIAIGRPGNRREPTGGASSPRPRS